jgi:hypothetical protein
MRQAFEARQGLASEVTRQQGSDMPDHHSKPCTTRNAARKLACLHDARPWRGHAVQP